MFALLKSVRLAGGWRGYLRVPCRRLLGLRILVNQNRAWTEDPLLKRLFPSAPPVEGFKRALADALAKRHVLVDSDALAAAVASALTADHMELRPAKDAKRPREAYRAGDGRGLPKEVFWRIFSYWRSDRVPEVTV